MKINKIYRNIYIKINKMKTSFLSRKRANTTFLLRKSMNTRSSIREPVKNVLAVFVR